MPDEIARDALERELSCLLPMLSHDELRVIGVQMRRMIQIGRDKYGPLDLSQERRDWEAEAAAESSDQLFYDACARVARTERKRERIERFVSANDTASEQSCSAGNSSPRVVGECRLPTFTAGSRTNPANHPSSTHAPLLAASERPAVGHLFAVTVCAGCHEPLDGREHAAACWRAWESKR